MLFYNKLVLIDLSRIARIFRGEGHLRLCQPPENKVNCELTSCVLIVHVHSVTTHTV